MTEQLRLLVPVQNHGLRTRLEKAESLLARKQGQAAQGVLTRVFEILELDSPGAPSLVKSYVLSRRVLACAYQLSSEGDQDEEKLSQAKVRLLEELDGYLAYYEKLDSSYNIRSGYIFLSACRFTKGQVLYALKQWRAAELELEDLYEDLERSDIRSELFVRYKLDLELAIARELVSLGLPLDPDRLAGLNANKGSRKPAPTPLVNYRSYLRYQDELMICDVRDGCTIQSAADGSTTWINPSDPEDVKLLLQGPEYLMETDDFSVLQDIDNPKYEPYSQCLVYQPWPEPREGSDLRLFEAVTPKVARRMGECISGSPVRHLFLVFVGMHAGALAELIQGLNGHKLDTLGLAWYFSGEDITDDKAMASQIGDTCKACKNARLLLLTPGWYEYLEKNLLSAFEGVPTLKECRVFWTKSNNIHRPIQTKALDALLQSR